MTDPTIPVPPLRTLASNCSDAIARTATQPCSQGSGGSSDYYKALVRHPTTPGVDPYMAECNDIIEALDMTFAEGNAFKAIWRTSAARLGREKAGNDAVRDAQKVQFFGGRMEQAALNAPED